MSEGAIVNGELRAAAGNNIRLLSSCSALLYCAVLDFRRVTIVYSVVHSTCRRIIHTLGSVNIEVHSRL